MATHSDFTSGDMPVEGQNKTFDGFVGATKWGTGIIIMICLYAILTFAVKLAWMSALIATFVVGVLYGMGLKMKTGWYALVFGLAVFGAIVSILISVLH